MQFTREECGDNLPKAGYVGAVNILQINGGNGGFTVSPVGPNDARPKAWFYALSQIPADYGFGVVYFRVPVLS